MMNEIQLGDLIFAVDDKKEKAYSGFVAAFAYEPKLLTAQGYAVRNESNHLGYTIVPFPLLFTKQAQLVTMKVHVKNVIAAYRLNRNPGFMIAEYAHPDTYCELDFVKVPLPKETSNHPVIQQ